MFKHETRAESRIITNMYSYAVIVQVLSPAQLLPIRVDSPRLRCAGRPSLRLWRKEGYFAF
jgi:hypothetical protein